VSLIGAGNGHTLSEYAGEVIAASVLLWYGDDLGTVLKVQGPIPGVHLEGFGIDCAPTGGASVAGTGLLVEHAYRSVFERLTIQRFSAIGVDLTAYSTHASAATGANDNVWGTVSVQWPTGLAATGIRVGSSDGAGSLDVARNLFLSCSFRCVNGSGNVGSAIHLRFTDACTFVGCETAGTYSIEVTPPAANTVFPSSTTRPASSPTAPGRVWAARSASAWPAPAPSACSATRPASSRSGTTPTPCTCSTCSTAR
jgi:hypothetical protein